MGHRSSRDKENNIKNPESDIGFTGAWLRVFSVFRKCAARHLSVSQKRAAHTKCEKGFGKPNMQVSVWKTITNRPCLPSTEEGKLMLLMVKTVNMVKTVIFRIEKRRFSMYNQKC